MGRPVKSVQILARSWYNPNLDSSWSMVPSLIGTLTMMGTMMLTALSVAREREQGTFDQLLVTPFRPFEIMIGKAIPNLASVWLKRLRSCWLRSFGFAYRSSDPSSFFMRGSRCS
jgi:ABC-type multidrug transport system permease subunit